MWTKEETDKLFDLCDQFDLHFIVVADRFPTSRTVVELKNRYYSVSRAIVIARASAPSDVAGHPLVKVCWQGKYFILAFFVQEPEICKILFLPVTLQLHFCTETSQGLIWCHHGLCNSLQICKNRTMFHMRLSASAHCLWFSLKQSCKNEEMQRFLLKRREFLRLRMLRGVLMIWNIHPPLMLVQRSKIKLLLLILLHHLLIIRLKNQYKDSGKISFV